MKVLSKLSVMLLLCVWGTSLADLNRDNMAKDKPVWTDHWLSLIHQFQVNIHQQQDQCQ